MNVIRDVLNNKNQRVVLNGQNSSWVYVKTGVPQGSVLVLLFFLICINDLADNLAPNPQSFADDTPIFSVVRNMHASLLDLSNDLIKVFKWVFQLKKARKQSQ